MDQLADARLSDLAKAGEEPAFAELYDRYFDPVYDFAARILRDGGEAADAVRATFFDAMTSLGGLHRGAGFRSWIFAIARTAVLHRLEQSARPRGAASRPGEEATFDALDPSLLPLPPGAADPAIVWEAAAALDPRQLSLLDLHFRHGLDADEIAGVLRVTPENAAVTLKRLETTVERSLGDVLLLRSDGHQCEGLAAMRGAPDTPPLSPETRRLVEAHVSGCATCAARRSAFAPLAVFAALAPVAPPPGAREEILQGLLREWPGPVSSTREVPAGLRASEGRGDRRRRAAGVLGAAPLLIPVLAGLAGVLFGALFLPQSPVALVRDDGRDRLASPEVTVPVGGAAGTATPSSTPSSTSTATASATATTPSPTLTNTAVAGVPSATPSSTPSPTAMATSTPTPTPTRTSTPGPPTATPTPTATPCVAQLSAVPGAINIPPGNISGFNVVNGTACTTTFAVATDQFWLTASGGGSLPFGSSEVKVAVISSLVPTAPGTYTGHVEISWSSGSISVTVSTTRTGTP